uniref:Chemosensory protein 17 n=1 Tax=Oedaleus asiaticus TaxID=244712 RepID=A0A2D1AC31_9ORTH|nr:chemosensory protein 17 [Oedaleus asiaticus]
MSEGAEGTAACVGSCRDVTAVYIAAAGGCGRRLSRHSLPTPHRTLANMKSCAFALLLVGLVAAAAAYTTKYDNIDLDEILHNDRLLQNYYECLMKDDETGCTPDGVELKRTIPDALKTECSKCNEKQKEGTKKVLKFLINHKPDMWGNLKAKYDPDGTYAKKWEDKEKELHE